MKDYYPTKSFPHREIQEFLLKEKEEHEKECNQVIEIYFASIEKRKNAKESRFLRHFSHHDELLSIIMSKEVMIGTKFVFALETLNTAPPKNATKSFTYESWFNDIFLHLAETPVCGTSGISVDSTFYQDLRLAYNSFRFYEEESLRLTRDENALGTVSPDFMDHMDKKFSSLDIQSSDVTEHDLELLECSREDFMRNRREYRNEYATKIAQSLAKLHLKEHILEPSNIVIPMWLDINGLRHCICVIVQTGEKEIHVYNSLSKYKKKRFETHWSLFYLGHK